MKNIFKNLVIVASCCFLLAATINANAFVVSGTNVTLSGSGNSFGISVDQSGIQNQMDLTTLWFSKTYDTRTRNVTLSPTTWNVDEEADYYLTKYGDELSRDTINAGAYSPFFTSDHPYTLTLPSNSIFYLGINTGRLAQKCGINGCTLDFSAMRNVYGWVKLRSTSTTLSILDSAMAYGDAGIFVGTTTSIPIPEADTYSMLLLGLGYLSFRVRREINS